MAEIHVLDDEENELSEDYTTYDESGSTDLPLLLGLENETSEKVFVLKSHEVDGNRLYQVLHEEDLTETIQNQDSYLQEYNDEFVEEPSVGSVGELDNQEDYYTKENEHLTDEICEEQETVTAKPETIESDPVVCVTSSKKRKLEEKEANSNPPETNSQNNDWDEDIAFGNMMSCMLHKIPKRLKTQIKLKLMQSFAEFEAEHELE